MNVFDKANSIWEQKQDEVQKEKEIAHKKSEAARRGWETRRAKAKAALRIQRMMRCFISKTSVLQEAEQAFTEHGTGHRTKTSWIKPTRKTKIRTTQTRTLTSMKKVETAINTIGTKQSQGPETKGPMVRSLAIGNR